MSDDSRSMVAVLVICAMLMLVCIAVPVGVGAIFFVRLQASTQQAVAAQRAALAAEQARMQAELARQAAEMQAEQLRKAAAAIPPVAAPPQSPAGKELTLDQRKFIYLQLKLVNDERAVLDALDALGTEDPALKEAADQGRAQFEAAFDRIGAAAGITRKQLDEIIAEGKREMW